MSFTDTSWLEPALKCFMVVTGMAMLTVGLSALGAWWMGKRKKGKR